MQNALYSNFYVWLDKRYVKFDKFSPIANRTYKWINLADNMSYEFESNVLYDISIAGTLMFKFFKSGSEYLSIICLK